MNDKWRHRWVLLVAALVWFFLMTNVVEVADWLADQLNLPSAPVTAALLTVISAGIIFSVVVPFIPELTQLPKRIGAVIAAIRAADRAADNKKENQDG